MKLKILLISLYLTFSITIYVKANDIRDFEIDGISVGDSLLDYFSKKEIISSKQYLYNSKKVATFYAPKNYSNDYEWLALNFFDNDNNYKIESIEGQIDYPQNINKCYDLKKKISNELKKIFLDTRVENYNGKHQADTTGKSTVKSVHFYFKDTSEVRVACMDFSKNVVYTDYLMVAINSKKFMNFINLEAWE